MDLTTRAHRLHRRALWMVALTPLPVVPAVMWSTQASGPALAWSACYFVFLGIFRASPGRQRWIGACAAGQFVAALLCAWLLATSAEGAMLVAASSLLATRWPAWRVGTISASASVAFGLLLAQTRSIEFAVDVPLAWFVFQVFAILLTAVVRAEAESRVALAERNVQLLAARRMLEARSRLAERIKVTRDLHDGMGHHLTALNLNLEAALHDRGDEVQTHLSRARLAAGDLLADVRRIVADTRADHVDPLPSIRALARGVTHPTVHVEAPASLEGLRPAMSDEPLALVDALVRLAQEAMTNTMRHGSADHLWIRITRGNGDLCLDARDDGRGCAAVTDGAGLYGMRARVAEMGGTFEAGNAEGGGFRVMARIPIIEVRA